MQRPEPDLYKHDDIINEQLARYGVKFGIYKNQVTIQDTP